uniref:MARVEL domain-containing protein n=1 Tax=Cuerna arida TaxID=1464854 RepID=A0A1B6FDD7_9HEMI
MKVVEKIKSKLLKFQNKSLQLKSLALVLNLLNIIFWRAPARGVPGVIGPSQECLFAHTVPAYTVILACLVLVYVLGGRCGPWFHRVYELSGSALFGTCAVIEVFNYLQDSLGVFPLLIGVVCGVISLILLIDVMINEESFSSNIQN